MVDPRDEQNGNRRSSRGVLRRLLGDADETAEARWQNGANEEKLQTKQRYDLFNRKLNDLKFSRYVFFLNFGYVPSDNPSYAVFTPEPGHFDINSRRLVLEVIADCPVNGQDVLDVSCGRGAVATVLKDHFHPRSYTGIDISTEAVAFCRHHHRETGFAFEEADAEALPLSNSAFDVAINIEASHTYPRINSFFRETYRVLRPNGWFLYTDFATPRGFDRHVDLLQQLGFQMTRDLDITENVILSRDEMGQKQLKAYRDPRDRAFVSDEFIALPGSETYRALENGSLVYRLFSFRKIGNRE